MKLLFFAMHVQLLNTRCHVQCFCLPAAPRPPLLSNTFAPRVVPTVPIGWPSRKRAAESFQSDEPLPRCSGGGDEQISEQHLCFQKAFQEHFRKDLPFTDSMDESEWQYLR